MICANPQKRVKTVPAIEGMHSEMRKAKKTDAHIYISASGETLLVDASGRPDLREALRFGLARANRELPERRAD